MLPNEAIRPEAGGLLLIGGFGSPSIRRRLYRWQTETEQTSGGTAAGGLLPNRASAGLKSFGRYGQTETGGNSVLDMKVLEMMDKLTGFVYVYGASTAQMFLSSKVH